MEGLARNECNSGDSRIMVANDGQFLLHLIGLMILQRHIDQRARVTLGKGLQFALLPSSFRKGLEHSGANFRVHHGAHQRRRALHGHGRGDLAQLLLRGAL